MNWLYACLQGYFKNIHQISNATVIKFTTCPVQNRKAFAPSNRNRRFSACSICLAATLIFVIMSSVALMTCFWRSASAAFTLLTIELWISQDRIISSSFTDPFRISSAVSILLTCSDIFAILASNYAPAPMQTVQHSSTT